MMQLFSSFHFLRPITLGLLPLVAGLWWMWRRQSDPLRGWRRQMEPELLQALLVKPEGVRQASHLGILIAWILAVIAVSGPTWRLEPSPFLDDATPLMLLLKADVSMETPDPAPSRMEHARLKIADLAAARKGLPLGLIAYSGSAHLVLPPTRDTSTVTTMAAEIGPDIMPEPGDRLDLALNLAQKTLSPEGQNGLVFVLADSVQVDDQVLKNRPGLSVNFLAFNTQGSDQDKSIRAAAQSLHGKVVQMSIGDEDISEIVRLASRAPVAQAGDQNAKWQESGYWIVPFIIVLFLVSFRREVQPQEVV